ncbi:hypothetical protein HHI36_001304 [Cryptolaemus montrouzieri]|uniref:Uncharacterized protein n=1 Tax=Cryptolaemus montrouzieri TaxID=559131 RepID=A0ABD2P801_9CUCU
MVSLIYSGTELIKQEIKVSTPTKVIEYKEIFIIYNLALTMLNGEACNLFEQVPSQLRHATFAKQPRKYSKSKLLSPTTHRRILHVRFGHITWIDSETDQKEINLFPIEQLTETA